MAAQALSYNPEHHQRVKHVERQHFFIRELVENLKVRVPHVRTEDNTSDIFTKPLQGNTYYTGYVTSS